MDMFYLAPSFTFKSFAISFERQKQSRF